MGRLIDADKLKQHYSWWGDDLERQVFDDIVDQQPTAKPPLTEEVGEALMRLTMCAREECSMCKYENECEYDTQVKVATKSMNTILEAFEHNE